ncbi:MULTISPECIES: lasso peptide biosynthesis B2 protein [unclassified Anabaena]|uniref:lasso peptide biosynthesis B2 protein n=1 Tax=unclassified Anabaena TaxID=2619674 RepID=UPI0039C69ABF
MKRLYKLLRLTKNLPLLLRTFIIMTMIRLGLKLLAWRNLHKLVGKIVSASPNIPKPDEIVWRRVVWAVEIVSQYMIPKPTCLARALVTHILLAQQGYRTDLRIGVAKTQQEKFEAHAWVEIQGQVIIGNSRNLSYFIPLPPLYQKVV